MKNKQQQLRELIRSVVREIINEDLRGWFGKGKTGSTTGGGWDRYSTTGEKLGKCGDAEEGESYSACLSKEKANKLGPEGRAAFVKRKQAAQKKAGDAKKGGEQSKLKSLFLLRLVLNTPILEINKHYIYII